MIVYLVRCNEKPCYVGVTTQLLARRWATHLYEARKGTARALYHAMRKYGANAFTIEALAEAHNRAELQELERTFIVKLGTRAPAGYNMTEGGEGSAGLVFTEERNAKVSAGNKGRVKSPEERAKLSAAGKTRGVPRSTIEAGAAACRGVPLSEERRQQISAAMTGRTVNPEAVAKTRAALTGRVVPPEESAKSAAARRGKPLSAAHRASLALAQQARRARERVP
jgi:group I intron endonuclease